MSTWYGLKNFAKSTLSAQMADTDTTAFVADITKMPASVPFMMTVWDHSYYTDPADDPNREIMKVTAINGNALTVVRAQEGTTASSHTSDAVAGLLTAGVVEQVTDAIDQHAHTGVAGQGVQIEHSDLAGQTITTSGHTMSSGRVLGRTTASSGAIEQLSVTGSGNVVLNQSPALTTPDIGAATATSINVDSPSTPTAGRIYAGSTVGSFSDGSSAQITARTWSDTATTGPIFTAYRYRGSNASPAPVHSGDTLSSVTTYALDEGSTVRTAGLYRVVADAAPTETAVPSRHEWLTGSNALLQLQSDGDLQLQQTSAAVLCKAGTTNHAAVTDAAGIFAKDVSSSAELFAVDEAGNVTQLSPHNPDTGKWEFYSENIKTGRRVRVDMERLVRLVEQLTGESLLVEE